MLEDRITVTVGAEERTPRLTRHPDSKTNSAGRTCATAEGSCEISTGSTVSKSGDKKLFASMDDHGNFIDGDSNRYDSEANVNISLTIPAEGYTEAHVFNMLSGLYTYLTTADGNGETPLQRMAMGEK